MHRALRQAIVDELKLIEHSWSSEDTADKLGMDEEELVIDSPDLSPVEDEELEDLEDNVKLGLPYTSAQKSPFKDRDGSREQVS